MSSRPLFRRLLRQARPYRLGLVGLLLASLLSAPLTLLLPLPVKIAIDNVLGDEPLPLFLQSLLPQSWLGSQSALLALAVGILLGATLLQYLRAMLQTILKAYTAEGLNLSFRARLFDHAQRMSLAFHDAKGTSDTTYKIQYDATAVQGVLVDALIPILQSVFILVAMIGVTARLDWQLTVLAIAICPVLLILERLFRARLRGLWHRSKEIDESVLGIVQEVLSTLRVVKAFGQETRELNRFTARAHQGIWAKIKAMASESLFALLIGMTVAAGTAAVLYMGVQHVESGVISLGDLVLVMLYLAMLYQPVETIGQKLTVLQSALASAERAFGLLDHAVEVHERPDARALDRSRGQVAFHGVTFAYEPDHPVLCDVCFEVEPGTRVGLAGSSGSGKSTLLSLLPRFYDPSEGEVYLDGVDLCAYQLDDLRRQFAIVLQDTVLASATIAENIAYGRPESSEEEIIQAARQANAHTFIEQLPFGYQTQVGERGMRLSGGQRQRIGLARAFLRNAPILLLDEPTSAVDVKTEQLVMEAMDRLMQGRTTFLASHRPGTLDACDVLLRLDKGRLSISHNVAEA